MFSNENKQIKKRKIDTTYIQLLVVLLSFTLMIVITLFIVSDMIRKQLQRDSLNLINEARILIEAELNETKVITRILADNVEKMIEFGFNYYEVTAHISNVAYLLNSRVENLYYGTIHGYFPTLHPTYFNSSGWKPSQDYEPTERPWHEIALKGQGKPMFTTLYVNAIDGEKNVGFSQQMFSSQGENLGVISININVDKITKHVQGLSLTEGGYGVLVTESYEYVYHPSNEIIGSTLSDLFPNLYEAHSTFGYVHEFEMINYFGDSSIIYSTDLVNGWTLFLITPSREYYAQLSQLIFTIGVIGLISTIFLCTIIYRLNRRRKKLEQKQSEQFAQILTLEKLREADNRVRESFDKIPFGICYWTCKLELIDCNKHMLKMLGAEDKVHFLNHFLQYSTERQAGFDSAELAQTKLKDAFTTGSCYFEWDHKRVDGTIIPCKVAMVPVYFCDEPLVLACVIDVTEEKQAMFHMQQIQKDLLQAKYSAEESNKIKSKFLAMVSHEIRTPMNVILGVTEANLASDSLDHETRISFESISDAGNILLSIINDILDLSKIEAGKFELMPTIFDTISLIRDVTYVNRIRYEHKAVTFTIDIEENIPAQLYGDELRIKQIMNNILSNAFKYTETGQVTLHIGLDHTRQSYKRDFSTEDNLTIWLNITIHDSGIGMTSDQLHMLFNEYSRFNLNSNRKKEGTGLGMSITSNLVHMMKGHIHVESTIDIGTTVEIVLPLRQVGVEVLGKQVTNLIEDLQVDRIHNKQKTKLNRDQMPYGRILVVDDMKTNIDVIRMLLKPYKLQVTTASSGFEAIERIKEEQSFDIVFMDHMMPDMDGIETTKILRDMGYNKPIIALSANAVVGQAEVFLEQGFDEFISKPIDTRRLHDILNRWVRDKHCEEKTP